MGKGKVKHEPKGQVHGAPGTARATKTPRPVDPIEPTVRLGKSPPPLPPREALEARAAWQGTPDAVGAWWISLIQQSHIVCRKFNRQCIKIFFDMLDGLAAGKGYDRPSLI